MLHSFTFVKPATLEEATAFLAEHGAQTTVFAGGTDLFVVMRAGLVKPTYVLDLKGIAELRRLVLNADGSLSIGACVTVNEVVDSEDVRKHYNILHVAGSDLASHQLRNRATVVGNIVTASPCGDMSSPLMCLGGEVVLASKAGSRRMPLREFITGVKKTLIQPDELVVSIEVPPTFKGAVGAYEKLKRIKGHDLGIVNVAVVKHGATVRVAVGSAAPTPVLLPDFKAGVSVEEVQQTAAKMISPIDDVRGSKDYRYHMVNVFIKRLMSEVQAV